MAALRAEHILASSSGIPIAVGVVLGILYLAILAVLIWAYVNVISRAGYHGAWVLILLVPLVNIVMMLIFCFKEWPATRELKYLRGIVGIDPNLRPGEGAPQHGQPVYGAPVDYGPPANYGGYGMPGQYPQNPGPENTGTQNPGTGGYPTQPPGF
jgi:hypothetical protein